ncbi:MAG: ABC transporter ATP-binding protein [Arthrobacter sp.]|uniref:ABC transporter ATP-binding protein n=1 Tax=Arthrobacter sp. AOP36-C1-22 TaxID=3457683 RepID=UPI00264C09C4|nr:ABC transporter ATP-binding protein [Micrococcaceae bacterium]MDN5813291.1 ABC transporter ATP-binding protein [Micrococcaceae bacterium]MDN5823767.1 ABC transporter ATP-binding protein [Micrococcaceae bacterium]MDN5879312.1 ABC transporter ATP-binding protein [Micrococcaceae bacterium]MDN5885580.1 ABC transporter ATP-binding protein [Micrococcaceae bacterium]
MSATLVIEDLITTFPGTVRPALAGISLEVRAGSCTAVLGPSGSGKSTLLRSVAGLEVPDAGRVVLGGTDLAPIRPEQRGISLVSQRPLLFPHLNVLDNVAFAARVRGVPRREARRDAADFLDVVQLGDLGNRRATELSGGQQQRVALARALAARPGLLLLDEPFSALDPGLRTSMHDLLAEVRRQLSPTLLLVTHDRDEAVAVAERVALLGNGCLLQHAAVQEIYTRPVSLEVNRLMGGLNEVPGTVRGGRHESELGSLALPEDAAGASGPGTLIFRQESIMVSGVDGPGIPAIVSAVKPQGARRILTVQVGGQLLHAEAPWALPVAQGTPVRLQIPRSALWVLPEEPTATTTGSTPNATGDAIDQLVTDHV